MRVLVNNYLGGGTIYFAARLSEYHPKGRRTARNERCPVGAESESALAGGTPSDIASGLRIARPGEKSPNHDLR